MAFDCGCMGGDDADGLRGRLGGFGRRNSRSERIRLGRSGAEYLLLLECSEPRRITQRTLVLHLPPGGDRLRAQ